MRQKKTPEAPPQPAEAPEKKPAAPMAVAMRQVEEKITEDLAGELL